ncbi:hypothetical protein [Microbacterium sp. MYb64]|uniref:hypothetical protein n=1 Tax=Microbacterium sp. MYb64 TaxID=1848691 RepID=UPI000CFDD59D|nr:hypothetical protein [Microbacterium sp. MYb64]PRB01755.1 hypothetical protein CQ044_16535 [Microbacterium sp. MYb64]
MVAPITLTFTNATVTLSRVGDMVTAVVSYAAAAPSGFQALPVAFQPTAGDLTFVSTGNYSAPGTITMQVSVVVGDAGIGLGGYNSPPTVAGSFTARWLADPATSDTPAGAATTLTFSDGSTVTLSRVGNVVTAAAVPGTNPNTVLVTLPLPIMFSPSGNLAAYEFKTAGTYGEPGNWFITVMETPAFGSALGVSVGAGSAGPWAPFTVQWLADASTAPPSTDDDELAEFYVHSVLVETFLGTNGYGEDTFAPAVAVGGFLDDTRHLVRSQTAEQVVSEGQFYTRPENGALFPADSRVTVDGVTSRVIRTNTNTSGNLDLPDHAVISLT